PDGSMIRLTVARYHTPTGRVIQKPYNMGKLDSYYMDLSSRYEKGELFNQDSISFPDSLKFYTLRNQKLVYGGGGIMPDLFIPIDTSYYSDYYGKLVRRGIINQFVLSYIDEQRDFLKRSYPKFDKFDKYFNVDNIVINKLIDYAEKQGVQYDAEGIKTSMDELSIQIKGLIAQNLFSTNYYFQVVNKENKSLQKAVEIINNWDSYKHLVKE
ncbi:MAG TPA: peptidase S41, partial [Tenuifilaceae bacterium]|nr:peptidase S41 [Tenuifilaceae bacterium]